MDLRYAISCESVGEKDLRVRTNNKVIHLGADSIPSREEWVKSIKKVIFKVQNMGDSVKVIDHGIYRCFITFSYTPLDCDTLLRYR